MGWVGFGACGESAKDPLRSGGPSVRRAETISVFLTLGQSLPILPGFGDCGGLSGPERRSVREKAAGNRLKERGGGGRFPRQDRNSRVWRRNRPRQRDKYSLTKRPSVP